MMAGESGVPNNVLPDDDNHTIIIINLIDS